jgi:glutamate synthase (NADPH/NADH) small chain
MITLEVVSVAETKPKPKLNKKAVEMAKQEPEVRAKNFSEVALGYTEAEALEEASRCLGCPNPQCVSGCPVRFRFQNSLRLLKRKSTLKASRLSKPKTPCQRFVDVFAHRKSSARANVLLAEWAIQ